MNLPSAKSPAPHRPNSSATELSGDFLLMATGFGFRLNQNLNTHDACYHAVNDALALTECDRLSIGLMRGKRMRIEAVSGQEKMVARSESIRRLRRLCQKVVALDQPVIFSGMTEELDEQIATEMKAYVEESRVRMIALLPLRGPIENQKRQSNTGTEDREQTMESFGLLVAEFFGEVPADPGMPRRYRLVADHIQSSLYTAQAYDRIPFSKWLRWTSRVTGYFQGRRLLFAFAGLAVAIAIISALVLVPGTYRVSCEGAFLPANRQRIFAPTEAKVAAVLVEDGEVVESGDPLLRLESEVLTADLVTARVRVDEQSKLVEALSARLSNLNLGRMEGDSLELQGELTRAEIELAGAKETLAVFSRRAGRLLVRSPIAGVISGFRLREHLLHRPVNRGDLLLQVAQPDGPWHLELELDEFRAGPVASKLADTDRRLKVKYVLATRVGVTNFGELSSISNQVELSQNGQGYVIHAIATTSEADRPVDYIGAEVFAKIEVGQKPIGYVLFGDIIDFLRRTLLF